MYKGILLMLLTAICVTIGQLLWKIGVDNNKLYIVMGFIFYGGGAVLMIIAYRYGAVSVLQPLMSISYIGAIILGYIALHEPITYGKVIGILLITCGTILLSRENIV